MPVLRQRNQAVQYCEHAPAKVKLRSPIKGKPQVIEPYIDLPPPLKTWSLPYDVCLIIFEKIARPATKDVAAYKAYQNQIAQLCLICKGTDDAARTLLLKSPRFNYVRHDSHRARVHLLEALEAAEEQETGIAYATKHFTYANYPAESDTRLPRTSLLASILDITHLTSLALSLSRASSTYTHHRRATPLGEIVKAFQFAAFNLSQLQSLRLEGFETPDGTFTAVFVGLLTLPALRRLHISMGSHGYETLPKLKPAELNVIQNSKLQYLYLDRGYGWGERISAIGFLDLVPPSTTTLALSSCGYWSTIFGKHMWSGLPQLKHLAIDESSSGLFSLPAGLISFRYTTMAYDPVHPPIPGWWSNYNKIKRLSINNISDTVFRMLESPGTAHLEMLQYGEYVSADALVAELAVQLHCWARGIVKEQSKVSTEAWLDEMETWPALHFQIALG